MRKQQSYKEPDLYETSKATIDKFIASNDFFFLDKVDAFDYD